MNSLAPRRHLLALSVLAVTLLVGSTAGAVAGSMVTSQQIKNGTITSIDVKDGSLRPGDLTAAAAQSFTRVQGYRVIRRQTDVVSGDSGSVSASCPSGTRVIGGGSFFGGTAIGTQFAIAPDGSGASGYGRNTSAFDDTINVDIVCASVTPAPLG